MTLTDEAWHPTPSEWAEIGHRFREPFPDDEIKIFPGATNKEKTKALAMAYIDVRAVEDRLDDVVGPGNWETSLEGPFTEGGGLAMKCTLTVCGVSKSDFGYPNEASDTDKPGKEPLKAAVSDAIKRAAVQWGIGRFLYSLPQEWREVEKVGNSDRVRFKDSQYHSRPMPTPRTVNRQTGEITEQPMPSKKPAVKPDGRFDVSLNPEGKPGVRQIQAIQIMSKQLGIPDGEPKEGWTYTTAAARIKVLQELLSQKGKSSQQAQQYPEDRAKHAAPALEVAEF